MRKAVWVFSCSFAAVAQDPANWSQPVEELRKAIRSGELTQAADLASALDARVQAAHKAWLVRDAGALVDTVLSWLPAETESVWVNQDPFVVRGADSSESLDFHPAQRYSTERLLALNWGRILDGRRVRLVVAASIRNATHPSSPFTNDAQEVAYFYFLDGPLDAPPQSAGSIEGKLFWLASANIYSDQLPSPGLEPTRREDRNWIVHMRPDVLLLSNREAVVVDVLRSSSGSASRRALPPSLPEWQHIDRKASFWGLRHYAPEAKPLPGARSFLRARLPDPDGRATGVAVRFDAESQDLEVRYLTGGDVDVEASSLDPLAKVDLMEQGVWRVRANVRERGPFPFSTAMRMLGFGDYR